MTSRVTVRRVAHHQRLPPLRPAVWPLTNARPRAVLVPAYSRDARALGAAGGGADEPVLTLLPRREHHAAAVLQVHRRHLVADAHSIRLNSRVHALRHQKPAEGSTPRACQHALESVPEAQARLSRAARCGTASVADFSHCGGAYLDADSRRAERRCRRTAGPSSKGLRSAERGRSRVVGTSGASPAVCPAARRDGNQTKRASLGKGGITELMRLYGKKKKYFPRFWEACLR